MDVHFQLPGGQKVYSGLMGYLFGLGDRLEDLRDWIESLGFWGPVVFVIFYTAAVMAAIPGSLLAVAAGAMFGSLLGVILVSMASTSGASIDFLIARYFARESIARWLSQNEKFRMLDQLAESRGAIVVALTRLVPLFPFNRNKLFGLQAVESVHPFASYRAQLFLREGHRLPASLSGSPKTVQSASRTSFFRQLSIPGG